MRHPNPLTPFSVDALREHDAEFFARPANGSQATACRAMVALELMDVTREDGRDLYRTNDAGRAKVAGERVGAK